MHGGFLILKEYVGVPNHQWWHAEWKLSWSIYTLHARFGTFGADVYAQSVLIDKISASELTRKFIKSALLVGQILRGTFLLQKIWIFFP